MEETEEGESLLEVLENIKEGNQELLKLSKKPSPLLNAHGDPDRRTDYPRARSPDTRSPNWSRSSSLSLSAMSESSLTSDGSSVVSYDASKQPKKKILKNPHRLRRGSNNRVRWNLPGEEKKETMSLQSFDSTNEIYGQARLSATEMRQKWKEADRNPVQGSSAPAQLHYGKNFNPAIQSYSDSALLNVSPSPSPSHSPSHYLLGGSPAAHRTLTTQGAQLASNMPRVIVTNEATSITNDPLKAFNHTLSPLASATAISGSPKRNFQSACSSGSPMRNFQSPPSSGSPKRNLQSTPNPHYQSDSILARRDVVGQRNDSPTSFDIDMPVLKFDHSNLSELEESTLEDRKRMHIFQFPQNSPVHSSPLAGLHARKVAAPVASAFLDDDDENDYDHLSPLHKPEETATAVKSKPQDRETVSSDPSSKSDLNQGSLEAAATYSDRDIEDALSALGDSDRSSRACSDTEMPPNVPQEAQNTVLTYVVGKGAIRVKSLDEERSRRECINKEVSKIESLDEESIDEGVGRIDEKRSSSESSKEGASVNEPIGEEASGEESLPIAFEDMGELNWQFSEASQESASLSGSQEVSQIFSVPDLIDTDYHENTSKEGERGRANIEAGLMSVKVVGKPDLVANELMVERDSVFFKSKEAGSRRFTDGRNDGATDLETGNVRAQATSSRGGSTSRTRLSIATEIGSASLAPRKGLTGKIPPQVPPQVSLKGARSKIPPPVSPKAPHTKISPHAPLKEPPRSKIPPPVAPKSFRGKPKPPQKLPPPVPPKTQRIKRQDRDLHGAPEPVPILPDSLPPMLEDFSPLSVLSSDLPSPITETNLLHVEDILPPPPEFAFAPSTDQDSLAVDHLQGAFPFDEILSSASNSTLVPDLEESPDRLVLETEQQRDSSSSSSSPPSVLRPNKHSWSVIHHSKVREKSAGGRGEEDSAHGPLSGGWGTTGQPNAQDQGVDDLSLRKGGSIVKGRWLNQHDEYADERGLAPTARSRELHPPSLDNRRGTSSTPNQQSSQETSTSSLAPKRSPYHPAPPVPQHLVNVSGQLSNKEKHLLPMLYASKPHMMKPVVHDTEKHIQEMLSEIDSESRDRRVNTASYGKQS